MVKINKTLGLALLTALAASCSSDNDVAQSNNPEIENGEAAYATLRIDLPTQQGVRALEGFDDGLASEYTVNDAKLLVFKKGTATSEGEYTFVESVDLGNMNPWKDQKSGGITTTANVTAELKNVSQTDLTENNIYGLVILNNKKSADGKDLKIALPSKEGTTYSAWNVPDNVTSSSMTDISNGIVMANAPEWQTSGDPKTLVPIDVTKVKPTAAQAEAAGAAATIHVERGLAKVTMAPFTETHPTGSSYSNDNVAIDAWTLDVTNKYSFPVHNINGLSGNDNYAKIWASTAETTTVGDKTVTSARFHDTTDNTFKRVYWGIDPNYDSKTQQLNLATSLDDCKKAFTMVHDMDANGQKAAFKTDFGIDHPQYCLENTFDINNMTQGQTTRVVIKATYKLGDNTAATFFKIAKKPELYNETNFKQIITSYLSTLGLTETTDYTLTLNDKNNDMTAAGTRAFNEHNFTIATSSKTTETAATLASKVNSYLNGEVSTYPDGVCYYIGRIKHFGDDETPWNAGELYGTNNLRYLGRYGVLRNNWYSLSINSISGPGEPIVPPVVPENPDDDNNHYINLSVKILQWAKRSQNLDL
jgi:hypothetical protein